MRLSYNQERKEFLLEKLVEDGGSIRASPKKSDEAVSVCWQTLKFSVTPKFHASKYHGCDRLKYLEGLADFCEDSVEQHHQVGLKNNRRRTKGGSAGIQGLDGSANCTPNGSS